MRAQWVRWLPWLLMGRCLLVFGANFSSGDQEAARFGVHEVVMNGDGSVANPWDTMATVTFTPSAGKREAKTVHAFYDGENTWRARVYVHVTGEWRWESHCETDAGLHGQSGSFRAAESRLRGRLLPHPQNPRQWITEDGRWFLNLNDTAYFLLCARDGNGDPVADDVARQYVRDDVEQGITSVRCFLASRSGGFSEATGQWQAWHFADDTLDRLRLDNLQIADRRLHMLLDDFPDVAVQLILFPLEGYARDDQFWGALTTTQRQRLLRQLVARFAAYPQLFWLMTNDAHYGEKFPRSNALVREVGAYLQSHDPWQHPRSTGHARRLPFYFGGEDWATYIHIEHAHDLGAAQYAPYHQFAKPVFLGEDRYEQDHGPSQDPFHMRYWQRRLYWTWLLSGGSANYGGRWWVVHPYRVTGRQPATYHRRPNYTFTTPLTGLDSVRAIRDYFEQRGIDLARYEPDHALAEDAQGRKDAQAPRLLRRGRDEWLVYHPHAAADAQAAQVTMDSAAQLRLDLRNVSGTFAVEWYRAADGHAQSTWDIQGGDWCTLTAPWPGADVVVRVVRK
ncbi:MAG: DUF5060 domain-containing protein [Pirellulaceae bacterium]